GDGELFAVRMPREPRDRAVISRQQVESAASGCLENSNSASVVTGRGEVSTVGTEADIENPGVTFFTEREEREFADDLPGGQAHELKLPVRALLGSEGQLGAVRKNIAKGHCLNATLELWSLELC